MRIEQIQHYKYREIQLFWILLLEHRLSCVCDSVYRLQIVVKTSEVS